MHICILTAKYPTRVDPTALTFVQQLAWTLADQGQKVTVICPLGVNRNKLYKAIPEYMSEKSFENHDVQVYFPKFLDCGQRNIGAINTAGITTFLFNHAVENIIKKYAINPDVLYGHFITPAGVTASTLGKKYNISSFAAYGESTPWTIHQLGVKKAKRMLETIHGIVSVSSANKAEIVSTGVIENEKVEVFPNGYRTARFENKDKVLSRERFGIPKDAFVVSFVGHFIERKGINILNQAVSQMKDVYLICAGKGELKPKGEHVLYANSVNPDDLAWFYSASDVFVLPTQNEGCCNAIIEAMACGLPIVSSNLPFNDDILDDSNSIRINPNDVKDIVNAIGILKNSDDMRKRLSEGSIEKAKSLTLEARAKNIIAFIERRL